MRVKIEIKYKLKSTKNILIKNQKNKDQVGKKNNTPKTWIEEWNWKLIKLLQKGKGKNKN